MYVTLCIYCPFDDKISQNELLFVKMLQVREWGVYAVKCIKHGVNLGWCIIYNCRHGNTCSKPR